ncbi:MAG: FHA domain-containing protein [Blautia sp.]|nr:FHA domain-containing protein [Blautia sp.]
MKAARSFTYNCHDDSGSMIYTCQPNDVIDDILYARLQRELIPHLLPVKKMRLSQTHLVYDLGNMIVFNAYKERIQPQAQRQLDKKRREIIRNLINSGIPLDTIMTDDQHVYFNETDGEIYFICLPLKDHDTERVYPGTTTGTTGSGTGQEIHTQPMEKAILRRCSDGSQYRMENTRLRVGRKPDEADAVITGNGRIGRLHCILSSEGGRYFIQDNRSVNGTVVNGHRLEAGGRAELTNGSRIKLADEEFIFEIRRP